MTTPYLTRKRRSSKLHTPASVYGIRNKKRRIGNEGEDSVSYIIRPERLSFKSEIGEDLGEGLEDLTGQTWRVFRVSPLHNFEYETVRLRQYGRRMRESLTSYHTDNIKDINYSVHFSAVEGIGVTEHDSEAIRITVDMKMERNSRQMKTYYSGFLLCRGAGTEMEESSSIRLPVLLCSGIAETIRLVHIHLQKFFDCSIAPLTLTQEELAWICALQIAENDNKIKQSAKVEMFFAVPTSLRNCITFKLPLMDLKRIWKIIKNKRADYVSFEEVKKFHNHLLLYLKTMFDINVTCCQLFRIKTPTLLISNETRVKTMSTEDMSFILKFLYDGSTIIDTSVPTLGLQPD